MSHAKPNVEGPKAPRTVMQRIRLRALAVLVGVATAAIATISLVGLPALPVVGVAVATVAVCLNKITSRLKAPVCYACGSDIAGLPSGEYGVICPSCGGMTPKGDDAVRQA